MPTRADERRAAGAGFTLLEVLVALVITGLMLTAVASVLGVGLHAHRTSDDAAAALTLAEGKMAMAGTAEPLRTGSHGGEFGSRFRWQLTVSRHDDREDKTSARFTPELSTMQLFRIEVTVSWTEGGHQRQVTLTTLRLGPAS